MLTVRCCKIIKDLLTTANPICIHELTERYHVSERSIKYDINKLRNWLRDEQTNVELEYINKDGFVLTGTPEDLAALHQFSHEGHKQILVYASQRISHFIFRLLTSYDYITLQEMADELLVSKNSVSRDIDTVDKKLRIWNIYLQRKTHWGFRVTAAEPKRRQALEYFILSQFDAKTIEESLVSLKKQMCPDNLRTILCPCLITEQEAMILGRYYWLFLQNIYANCRSLNAKTSIELFIRICVTLGQVRRGRILTGWTDSFHEHDSIYEILREQMNQLFLQAHIQISNEEIQWLLMPIAKESAVIPIVSLEKVTMQLIQRTSEIMQIPFTADGELHDNLVQHFQRSFIKRQSYTPCTNPLLDDIQHHYMNLFNIVKQISCDVFSAYSLFLQDEDAAYIALYFQLSYETMFGKERIRALVVCSTGVSLARFLMRQLQNKFDMLQIMGCCSVLDVDRFIKENPVDVIFSVLQLQTQIPCIVVNALLQKKDLEKIKDTLKNFKIQKVPQVNDSDPVSIPWNINEDEMLQNEKMTQEIIVKGYDIYLHIQEELGQYFRSQNTSGLVLHCLLMANRLAYGMPYMDITYAGQQNPQILAAKQVIANIVRPYFGIIPDSEVVAIINYLTFKEDEANDGNG